MINKKLYFLKKENQMNLHSLTCASAPPLWEEKKEAKVITQLPEEVWLLIFSYLKEKDLISARGVSKRFNQMIVEKIGDKKKQFDNFLNFLKDQLSEARYKKLENKLSRIGETIPSNDPVNSLKIAQLPQTFIFTQIDCALICIDELKEKEISNLRALANQKIELECSEKILTLALFYQRAFEAVKKISYNQNKAFFIKDMVKHAKAITIFHLPILREGLGYECISAFSILLEHLQLLENKKACSFLMTKALEVIPFIINNNFSNFPLQQRFLDQVCEIVFTINESKPCYEDFFKFIDSHPDLLIWDKFYALSAVQLFSTNFTAALELAVQINTTIFATTLLEIIFKNIDEEEIGQAVSFLSHRGNEISLEMQSFITFHIVSNLCSKNRLLDAIAIANGNEDHLNPSFIFAPIVLSLLQQKQTEIAIKYAARLSSNDENSQVEQLYTKIASLFLQAKKLKEAIDIIKKIASDDMKLSIIKKAIPLIFQQLNISFGHETSIPLGYYILDDFFPTDDPAHYFLRDLIFVRIVENLCKTNQTEEAFYIVNEKLQGEEEKKFAFEIIVKQLLKTDCYEELFDLASAVATKDNCYREIKNKIYAKLAVHYARSLSSDEDFKQALKAERKGKFSELTHFKKTIQELISAGSFAKTFKAMQIFTSTVPEAQELKNSIICGTNIGFIYQFIGQQDFDAVIQIISLVESYHIEYTIRTVFLGLLQTEKYDSVTVFMAILPEELSEIKNQILLETLHSYCENFLFFEASLILSMIFHQEMKQIALDEVTHALVEQLSKKEPQHLDPISHAFFHLISQDYCTQASELMQMIPEKFTKEKNEVFLSLINFWCQNNAIQSACQAAYLLEGSGKQLQITKEALKTLITNKRHDQAKCFIEAIAKRLTTTSEEIFLSVLTDSCTNYDFYYAWQVIDQIEKKQIALNAISSALRSLLDSEKPHKLEPVKNTLINLVTRFTDDKAITFIHMVPANFAEEIEQIYTTTILHLCKKSQTEGIKKILNIKSADRELQLQLIGDMSLTLLNDFGIKGFIDRLEGLRVIGAKEKDSIFVKMINALLQNPHLDRENSVCLVYSILDEIKEEWNKNIANMMIEEAYDKVYYT